MGRIISTGTNPKGELVTLVECDTCGGMGVATGQGHSATGDASDTEAHKLALAKKEREAK